MMTRQEWLAKNQIMKYLIEEGHPSYARLLDYFDINLTEDPNCIAAMQPGKARIFLNKGLEIDQVCTCVRHEILHEFFNHQERLLKHLGLDPDEVPADLHQLGNIAGDYDISNKGYTDQDKRIIRRLKLNGQKLRGLVTEDDHEDWLDLSFEDMFDKLKAEMEKNTPELPPEGQPQKKDRSDEYVDIYNKIVEKYNNDEISDKELKDLLNKVKNMSDEDIDTIL